MASRFGRWEFRPRLVVASHAHQEAGHTLDRLLRATPPEYQRPLILGYGAGLRWSEVAGLHLATSRHATGLDLQLGEIRVREVLEESRAGLVIRAYPKTASSRRTIPLAPSVLAALMASL